MYAGRMTEEQALQAMKEGHKVAHSYFCKDEYLHIVNGVITSEEGYNFEDWFNRRRADEGWKGDGLCWLIREEKESINLSADSQDYESIDPGYFWEELAVIEKEKRLK